MDPTATADRTPPIAIVMVSYRTGPALDDAMTAALGAAELERLILIDNGNEPATRQRLADWAAREPRLIYDISPTNLGFAKACNRGAALAEGADLLFLNPDARLPADGLTRLRATAKRLSGLWAVGARLIDTEGREQRGDRRGALTAIGLILEAMPSLARSCPQVLARHRFNRHRDPLPEDLCEIGTASGACLFLPRATFAALGGFDEGYFLHAEDIDLCERLRRQGGRVYFDPDFVVHHEGGSSDAARLKVEYHKAMGLIRFFVAHRGAIWRPWLWPLLAALPLRGLTRAILGAGRPAADRRS